MGGLIFVIVVIALILWVLASCIRIVPQAYAIVVERLGAYTDNMEHRHPFQRRRLSTE